MNALSLKGFLLIATMAGAVLAATMGAIAFLVGRSGAETLLFGLGGLPLGLMFAGGCYLAQLPGELRGLRLPPEDLLPDETIVMETEQSMVHYKTGRPERVWEGVGGKLVLTNRRLVFLAHRGQPYYYRLELPLVDIARADTSVRLAMVPGGLRITLAGERYELFTFGAINAAYAEPWSAAILAARNRLRGARH